MRQALCIELPRPGRVEPLCGEGTGSHPRHDITPPLCLVRSTDFGGQKRLHDSMAKVTDSHGGKGSRRAASTNPQWTAGSLWLVFLEYRNR